MKKASNSRQLLALLGVFILFSATGATSSASDKDSFLRYANGIWQTDGYSTETVAIDAGQSKIKIMSGQLPMYCYMQLEGTIVSVKRNSEQDIVVKQEPIEFYSSPIPYRDAPRTIYCPKSAEARIFHFRFANGTMFVKLDGAEKEGAFKRVK